ncbi:MAG: iron-sulfur cluster repair di-iron protein [Phycisphaerales bacterium]
MTHRDITAETPVGLIASSYPELLPEFERLGIDYCCGGRRSLADAAARADHDTDTVVEDLNSYEAPACDASEEIDWRNRSMTELADHIEGTHHAFARDALARLENLVAKCVRAHGDDDPRLLELQKIVAALTEDMHDHFVREERVLFPWLRRLERPTEITSGPPWSVRRPIDCMVHDHDDVGEAFARIRELTDDLTPPEDACSTWRTCYALLDELERDTHLHIHKENNILFPAGVEAEQKRGTGPSKRPAGALGGRPGCTLIELLVVVSVIAVLIAITLPAVGPAWSVGRSVASLSNTRSIATAMRMYTSHDELEHHPTARIPGMAMGDAPAAPFSISWISRLGTSLGVEVALPDNPTNEEIREYVERMQVCRLPRVIQHTRQAGDRANYVIADGHAGAHAFGDTWQQTGGDRPSRNRHDPRSRAWSQEPGLGGV